MVIRHRALAALLAAAVAVVPVISACATGTDPATPMPSPSAGDARIPAGPDITFRWIPGTVVDLTDPEGTFVRAFVESFELANAGRSLAWGYRGFVQAAPSNIGQMILAYPSDVSTQRPSVGTAIYTALRRVDYVDRTRIVLCRYGYRSYQESVGTSWSGRTDDARPVEIDFRHVGAAPPAAMTGFQREPDVSVFGGWYTTRFDFAARYPTPTVDEHACAASAPDSLPHRTSGHGARPWPVMPPSPGWSGTSVV